MVSVVSRIVASALAAVSLAACGGGQAAPKDATPTATVSPTGNAAAAPAKKQVCCESFGYGTGMVECCTKAAWSAPEACVVPPGFVGGGKRVVDDAKCNGS
jgi:hypothetical protein